MPMRTSKLLVRVLSIVGAVVLLCGAATGVAGAAVVHAVRYASPTGTAGNDAFNCQFHSECDFATAVQGAHDGDEVIVLPGQYTVNAKVTDTANIDIHGDFGSPPPEITAGSTVGILLAVVNSKSTVEYLDMNGGAAAGQSTMLLFAGSTAEQIQARSTGGAGTCEMLAGVLRDSVCVATAPTGFATEVDEFGTGNVALRNDTLVHTVNGSGAIHVVNATANPLNLTIANTIVAEPNLIQGILAQQTGTGLNANGPISVTIARSNVGGHAPADGSSGSISFTEVGGDQAPGVYAPLFVNPTAAIVNGTSPFDFHEAAGSPTINAGQLDSSDGDTLDLDRQVRSFGLAPDIGADEFGSHSPSDPGGPPTTTVPVVSPPGVTVPVVTPVVGVPVVSKVSLKASKSSKFAVKPKGRFKKRKRVRYGATLRYTVSVAASVRGTVQVKTKGRLVGKSCKKQSKSNKKRKACVLYKAVLVLPARSAKVGASAVAFTGVVGKKKLKAGKYRLQLVATDAGKRVSKPVFVTFQIVKG